MAFNKCRFCGKREAQFEYVYDGLMQQMVEVVCKVCNNRTGRYFIKEGAFNAWNEENKSYARGKRKKSVGI